MLGCGSVNEVPPTHCGSTEVDVKDGWHETGKSSSQARRKCRGIQTRTTRLHPRSPMDSNSKSRFSPPRCSLLLLVGVVAHARSNWSHVPRPALHVEPAPPGPGRLLTPPSESSPMAFVRGGTRSAQLRAKISCENSHHGGNGLVVPSHTWLTLRTGITMLLSRR